MTRRLLSQAEVSAPFATVQLPAVPGMIDEYLTVCATLAAKIGGELSQEERGRIGRRLTRRLAEAHAASSHSALNVVLVAGRGQPVRCQITAHRRTMERSYAGWLTTRNPVMFGEHPDARVWALAEQAADPGAHPVLDIGAGTGRNALPLARRGYPVDVVESTEKFADVIRVGAQQQFLDVRVIAGDVFANVDQLRRDYQLIVLSEVVSDFGTTQQLRGLFELADRCLAADARLVFNVFLVRPGYQLDDAAREFGKHFHTSFFSRDEICAAAAGLPLELVADDAVYDYEKAHLPDDAWPPTGWYVDWVKGLNPFVVEDGDGPVEMRWLVYRKAGSDR